MRLIIISNTVHNFFADSAIYWSGEEKIVWSYFLPIPHPQPSESIIL